MSTLIVAEHDNAEIKPATLNAVTAAVELAGQLPAVKTHRAGRR